MSILKMINGRNLSPSKFRDLHRYVTAPSKTKDGQTVGNSGCLSKHVVAEMLAVKRLHHKTGGRQWIHIAISLTPDEPHRPDDLYLSLATECVKLFPEFQSFYAVHHDTETRHLHIVLNTVSPTTGRKFSQSKSDLHRLKQRCNDILHRFGFDLINSDVTELESTDFSDENGFDSLEFDSTDTPLITSGNMIAVSDVIKVTDAIQVSDRISASDEIKRANDIRAESVFSSDYPGYINPDYRDILGGSCMNNQFFYPDYPISGSVNPCPIECAVPMPIQYVPAPQTSEPVTPSAPLPDSSQTTELENAPAVPQVIHPMSAFTPIPTMSISCGPHLILHENPSGLSISEETEELIRRYSVKAKGQSVDAANLAWAIHEKAVERGTPLNVHIDVSPTFEVDCERPFTPRFDDTDDDS